MARGTDQLAGSRRRLVFDTLGIAVSAAGFGFVYGLAARNAGFSPIEVLAMSSLVFAGGAQFAAIGYVQNGLSWPVIVLLTAFVNARHLLYAAVFAPLFADRSRRLRAIMAHFLNDETFALSMAHFRRIGRADMTGFWIAALGGTGIPWITAGLLGATIAGDLPEPSRLGLDVIFPSAMAGLALGLLTGRAEVVAAIVGVLGGVSVGFALSPAAGVVTAGLVGPAVAMLVGEDEMQTPSALVASTGLSKLSRGSGSS
jgi:predicted branched-subunit amino acid permease